VVISASLCRRPLQPAAGQALIFGKELHLRDLPATKPIIWPFQPPIKMVDQTFGCKVYPTAALTWPVLCPLLTNHLKVTMGDLMPSP
jgi:hypothetical protein